MKRAIEKANDSLKSGRATTSLQKVEICKCDTNFLHLFRKTVWNRRKNGVWKGWGEGVANRKTLPSICEGMDLNDVDGLSRIRNNLF